MKYILAIDQGTTSAHASLIDHEGNLFATAQKEINQIFPHPGWVEQDPMHLWNTMLNVIFEVIEKSKISSNDVQAIGIANQRETTIIWNKKTAAPLSNAIVWQDRRTLDFCNYLKKQGSEASIRSKTGLALDPYFSASKIHYLLEHSTEAKRLADQNSLAFGTVDSWLIWNLTKGKVHVTDASNASRTMLFNIHKNTWDNEILELFNIPASILPKVVSSAEVVGDAQIEGFNHSIPISAIVGDQSAALFGGLCTKNGECKNTYGTGCFLLVNTGNKILSSKHQLLSSIAWQLGKETTYALEGSVFVGGAVVQWLRDSLKIIKSSDEVEALATTVDSCDGVYFVPAFSGFAAPHWQPGARGTLFGLTRGTKPAHLARAALEGIAFQVADLFETMNQDLSASIKELKVDGGASRNDFLMQFQADLLNIPLIRSKNIETTSLGVGYLAGLGIDLWKNTKEVEKSWEIDKVFEPIDSDSAQDQWKKWKKAVICSKQWLADE